MFNSLFNLFKFYKVFTFYTLYSSTYYLKHLLINLEPIDFEILQSFFIEKSV